MRQEVVQQNIPAAMWCSAAYQACSKAPVLAGLETRPSDEEASKPSSWAPGLGPGFGSAGEEPGHFVRFV